MSKRSTSTPPLLEWAQDWAQLDRQTMGGFERALHNAQLLSEECDQTADGAWLLLVISTGLSAKAAVQEGRRLARLVNTAQVINSMPLRGGDAEIILFDGLVDVLNVMRARSLAANLMVTGCQGHWSATLTAVVAVSDLNPVLDLPAGSFAALGFEFGNVASATAGGDLLRRSALVTHEAFAGLAGVLGPLPAEHEVALDLFWPVQTLATEPATLH